MAHGSQVMNFEIALSDVDRGVYESLSLKVAQHPSETDQYLVARVLAYSLEYTEGIVFTGGLSSRNDPAIWVRDLTGQLDAWIEVGTPNGARVHKASKAAPRVVVYCHKDPSGWLHSLSKERIHAKERVSLLAMDPSVVDALAAALDRRSTWSVSRIDGIIYVDAGSESWELTITPLTW
jgi:uncharacterized protein YaeQ